VPVVAVTELLDSLHVLLRSTVALMTPQQAVANLQGDKIDSPAPDGLIGGCLAADSRFKQFPGGRFGLREWAWGIPTSLDEQLVACLRSGGKAESSLHLSQALNRMLPPEQPAHYTRVLETLCAGGAFRRVGSGMYALSEWFDAERERD
jgi:hypothetical protein